ncbi:MAG: fumarylacetoacetate hydrolase family protein [Hyphomicrobiales bacterium]|nr:fumarylacetoacetate hydrolase family protein [Hyphomicrobiales bacterium]
MKLVTFVTPSHEQHIGALGADMGTIVDFTASDPSPHFRDMLALIDGGEKALDAARGLRENSRSAVVAAAGQKLLAPVPEPRQMRDCLCFEKHLRQARASRMRRDDPSSTVTPADIKVVDVWYKQPIYYKCNRFSVVGPETEVEWPSYSQLLDYEMEFCIFTSKAGKNIAREKARDHIFGYSIFNDISARDAQAEEMAGMLGPAKGKDFDTGNIIGPWLVTADEVRDPYNLTMSVRVNGQERSSGNSGEMHHKFEDILAHVSKDETIRAGEFFGSGTVGGGCGLEIGGFLQPGDIVELEVTGLGVLRNRIGAPH